MAENGDIGFVASLFLFAGFNGLVLLIIQALRSRLDLKWKNIVAGIALGYLTSFLGARGIPEAHNPIPCGRAGP